MLQNVTQIPLTEGIQKRDFVFIEDAVEAIKIILNYTALKVEPGLIDYELGSGVSIAIKELVEKIKKMSGNKKTKLMFGATPYRENEAMMQSVNLDKLHQLGWFPKYTLDKGIEKTIKYERGEDE
jgi:nucleoside-diphosphate-sugar epimerase